MTRESFRCAACDEPVGLIRITRTYVRLGHLRQPNPMHPVVLSRPSAVPVASQLLGQRTTEAGHASRENSLVPASPDRRSSGSRVVPDVSVAVASPVLRDPGRTSLPPVSRSFGQTTRPGSQSAGRRS